MSINVTGGNAVWSILFLLALIKDGCRAGGEPALEILPSQPEQTHRVNSQLLLTCRPNVADTSLITDIQWQDNLNRTISGVKGRNRPPMYVDMITEGKSLSLLISSLTEAMAGTYHCSANYANTQKLHASVTIQTIIGITWKDAPANQYPIKGQDYKVKCDVFARPPPVVDWSKNGELILTNDHYVLEARGLLIKNVQESDDGMYTCRAAVVMTGDLDEKNIRLEVHTAPSMDTMPETVEVREGESASIKCQAKGKPPPLYSWVKSTTQQNLSNADRFMVNPHTGILSMNQVDQSDSGPFRCYATNKAGNAEAVVDVVVLVKPKIFEFLNVTSPITSETRIQCKASGRPAPLIEFKKYGVENYYVKGTQPSDDRIIVDQESDLEKGETVGTLTFLNSRRGDDGLYECKASNKADTAFKTGHVTIEFPPSFDASRGQPPVFSWDRRPANLTCVAESIPNATIEWRLNDKPLVEDHNMRIIGTGPSSSLLVTPVDKIYYRVYKCVATNRLGRQEHNVELRLANPPGSMLQSKIEQLSATSITFSLIGPGDEFGLPVRAFMVQYKDERNFDWNHAKNKTWSVDSPYIVETLAPLTTYDFRFAARNDVGLGAWGAPQKQIMPRRSFPEAPRLLTGSNSETGAVTSPYADHYELRWKIPADNGEPIDVYELVYCPVYKVNGEWTVTSEQDCFTEEMKAYENTAYEMNRLQADTYYRIRLRAHNLMGYSKPGEMYMKTARGMDTTVRSHEGPALSSTAIIGIVIAGILLMLLVVDVMLCWCRRYGVLATICNRKNKKHEEDEAKLGRDEKEPLKDCNERAIIDGSMMRNSSVEFDGRRAHAKTGDIIGKNSAV